MTYGILVVWSTQGMEQSHYATKTSFVKHSRHNNTSLRHSAIVQSFQWRYRVTQHREIQREKKIIKARNPIILAAQAATEKRWQASNLTTANARHAEWRRDCICDGSRFIPSIVLVLEDDAQPFL
jgi:hypothetical protein